MRVLFLGLIAVIGLVVAGSYALKADPGDVAYFDAAIERRAIVETVAATGSAEPLQLYLVQSEIPGVVSEVLATFNQRVKRGEILARLGSEIQQVQLEKAMADLDAAQAAERTAEVGVELARSAERAATADLDAARRMYQEAESNYKQDTPLVPKTKVDQAMDMLKKAQAGFESAQQQIAQAMAQFEAAKSRAEAARVGIKASQLELSKAELRSPVDGTILKMSCKVGDMVGRPKLSLTEPTDALFEVAVPMDRMQAIVLVNEVDYSRVRTGQMVKFTVDAYPDVTFEGKVTEVRNSVRSDRTSIAYDTVVEFENRRDPTTEEWMVRPRATCRADILVRSVEDVIATPNDALLFSPPAGVAELPATGSGESLLWVRGEGNTIEPRKVRTGVTDGFYTQIIAGDVKPGDRVVTGAPVSATGFKIPGLGG